MFNSIRISKTIFFFQLKYMYIHMLQNAIHIGYIQILLSNMFALSIKRFEKYFRLVSKLY